MYCEYWVFPHSSSLTPHPSPLTPHPSPLTPHPSPLTPTTMLTRFGNIDGLYATVPVAKYDLIANEITATVAYYLSADDAASGQYEPVHRKNVSWVVNADNSSTYATAISLANA